ncbi:MAG: GyrI-like domain-containing protein [Bacteroidetes bacterium]|nr:GyrI-like domain-containing protein [Bacteroidota bacterium]
MPEGINSLTIPTVEYAVFLYKGSPIDVSMFYERIFKKLASRFRLHFRRLSTLCGNGWRLQKKQTGIRKRKLDSG